MLYFCSKPQNNVFLSQHLYKSMEELVEMEIEIKADKRALETKVSRMQFDSMTEELNTMFQELLSKITGQEQDWHKIIDKISTEMECKLDRIELDPVKKQLEDRWKSIRKQLQAQPAPKEDDAAGIRKQLVARFHCISCDRPVDMLTPGPHLVTVPSTPGLPS
nr:glutamine-rich protein 2-like isoform X2 [Oncorhynchus nerka]